MKTATRTAKATAPKAATKSAAATKPAVNKAQATKPEAKADAAPTTGAKIAKLPAQPEHANTKATQRASLTTSNETGRNTKPAKKGATKADGKAGKATKAAAKAPKAKAPREAAAPRFDYSQKVVAVKGFEAREGTFAAWTIAAAAKAVELETLIATMAKHKEFLASRRGATDKETMDRVCRVRLRDLANAGEVIKFV